MRVETFNRIINLVSFRVYGTRRDNALVEFWHNVRKGKTGRNFSLGEVHAAIIAAPSEDEGQNLYYEVGRLIDKLLHWESTPQGHSYWDRIYVALTSAGIIADDPLNDSDLNIHLADVNMFG